MTHTLKIKEAYFWSLLSGDKKAEVRYNDRDFQKGDNLQFEIIEEKSDRDRPDLSHFGLYTWKITHVLTFPDGLKDGYVVLSLKKIK